MQREPTSLVFVNYINVDTHTQALGTHNGGNLHLIYVLSGADVDNDIIKA